MCDLADDCGDGSDEEGCSNHWKCEEFRDNSSDRKYLRLDSVCDGRFDCRDLSDECNKGCDKRINDSLELRGFAWVVGVSASLINLLVLGRTVKDIALVKTQVALLNYTFILLIALGDLMIGAYLLSIATADQDQGDAYCKTRLEWLISYKCTILGIVSTTGSQISLFAMTCLSLYRAKYVSRQLPHPEILNRESKVSAVVLAVVVIMVSAGIAVIPILPSLEDYFINGLYYATSPLLIGAPDKQDHLRAIEKHYGRFLTKQDVSWEVIRLMVKDMFTKDHNSIGVIGERLGFYGNSGVCLFKYFVTPDDPQRVYSLSVLSVNFLCFIAITTSYLYINFIATSVQTNNRTAALQRKVAVIILTDFLCWVPFIIFSLLHYSEVINATKYYNLCSIVILPVNSVINPLLYDDLLQGAVLGVYKRLRACVRVVEHREDTGGVTMETAN